MSEDIDTIPDFLRVENIEPLSPEKAQRLQAWLRKAKRPTKEAPRRSDLPKTMEAASWALLKEIEADAERRKQERLAALKQYRKAKTT